MNRLPITRALISVSDKTGLVEFALRLHRAGVEIVSSGGTASALSEANIPVTEVADVTGAPEMLGGRVKTLHPGIHGGILADLGDEAHRSDLAERGIEPFGLVVVSLYPFESAVAAGASDTEILENIDIGGPTLIRAAAKNHAWVATVVSPDRYAEIADAIDRGWDNRGDAEEHGSGSILPHGSIRRSDRQLVREPRTQITSPSLSRRCRTSGTARTRISRRRCTPPAAPRDGGHQLKWFRARRCRSTTTPMPTRHGGLPTTFPVGLWRFVKHMNACGAAIGELLQGSVPHSLGL